MKNYWSCTNFADWLRGTPKPRAATSKEWLAWKKEARKKPIRYWLAEESLDFLQDFIHWPLEVFNNVHWYCQNRWITRSHGLTSLLQRGQWHDLDTRILHSLFDELVNFVEDKSPEAGIAHLQWAADLRHNEEWVDRQDPIYGQFTSQALAAQETLVLYKWWKEERPKRPDPMEASGLSKFYDEQRQLSKDPDDFWASFDYEKDEATRKHSTRLSDICHKLEQEQEDEDTEMLIRLMKIRRSLWT